MSSPQRLARIAGLFYLVVAIFGGFAHLYVRAKVYQPGDAATTADNVVANADLVRVGVVADLVQATFFLVVAMALYLLLKHVNTYVARAMVTFVAVAVAIMCLNMVHQFGALLVATDGSYASALGAGGSDAMVLLMLDLQHHGFLIAQIFFGLWLLPLGYLAHRSGMFPRALGVLLMIGCFSYLVDMLAMFLLPATADSISTFVLAPAAVAELWMVGYLLVKGVKTPRCTDLALVAA
jgi:hypothetical protein